MEPSKILVIDDERAICNGCRPSLSDKGLVVDACLSRTNGLDLLLGEE
jgi:DNA-binding response OmpR family regulator